jgi:hypothetical protein
MEGLGKEKKLLRFVFRCVLCLFQRIAEDTVFHPLS